MTQLSSSRARPLDGSQAIFTGTTPVLKCASSVGVAAALYGMSSRAALASSPRRTALRRTTALPSRLRCSESRPQVGSGTPVLWFKRTSEQKLEPQGRMPARYTFPSDSGSTACTPCDDCAVAGQCHSSAPSAWANLYTLPGPAKTPHPTYKAEPGPSSTVAGGQSTSAFQVVSMAPAAVSFTT